MEFCLPYHRSLNEEKFFQRKVESVKTGRGAGARVSPIAVTLRFFPLLRLIVVSARDAIDRTAPFARAGG